MGMYLVMKSGNTKIGNISATYLPIAQTCPASCPFKANGCYAQDGRVAIHVRRLEEKSEGMKAYDIVRKEAREIAANGANAEGRPLRLHVSGDVRSTAAARLLGHAAKRWDGKVYTYTHSWRDVARKSWGPISVLASCESVTQAAEAHKKGYAAAIVVEKHETDKAYKVGDMKVIPCPQQTREITCDKCQLCMRADTLHAQKAVVAFAAHGTGKKKVALKVLQPTAS